MPDDLVAAITAVWTEHLQIDDITPHDDFFELGGNSFMALLLLDQTRTEHGVEVDLDDFFDEPTIEGLLRRSRVVDTAAAGAGGELA